MLHVLLYFYDLRLPYFSTFYIQFNCQLRKNIALKFVPNDVGQCFTSEEII